MKHLSDEKRKEKLVSYLMSTRFKDDNLKYRDSNEMWLQSLTVEQLEDLKHEWDNYAMED